MMAVDPDEIPGGHIVDAASDPHPALTAEAEDEFVSGKMISPDVMLRAG
jgi:hypothetical protein